MPGESERQLVAAMILERPLCVSCLAERTFLDEDTVHRALSDIALTVRLWTTVETCRACRTIRTTYRLSRDAGPPGR